MHSLSERGKALRNCDTVTNSTSSTSPSWVFTGRTDVEAQTPVLWATWCKELTHWKRPWCWGRLRAGGEGDDRGWDGWMASPTKWTWVWVDSGSWWWTGRPGVLRFMGSQRVGHDWAMNWLTDYFIQLTETVLYQIVSQRKYEGKKFILPSLSHYIPSNKTFWGLA